VKALQFNLVLIVSLVSGSQATASKPVRLPGTAAAEKVAAKTDDVSPATQELLLQPEETAYEERTLSVQEPLPLGDATSTLSLDSLEQLALANNPAVSQAAARMTALRGRWTQAGLPPNPTIGYLADDIGEDDTAGKQGGFIGQDFITGGKLRLDRNVVYQEIQQAEQVLEATRLRTLTDLRVAYYAALVAQRRAELAEKLVRISDEAVSASRDLLASEQIPRAGLLQSEVEQQTSIILAQTADNELAAAWRQLSAVVGNEISPSRLTGELTQLPTLLVWNDELVRVTTGSPEMAAAFAEVARSEVALARACREPIPDVSTQVSVQQDNSTGDTVAGVQVGIPLPIWNRNQGGIRQAQAEVIQARRNASRVELDLKRRLAVAYQQYADARARAEIYATQILPKSQETFDLVQRGYRLGELGYLDLISAQRIYSQTNLAYLDALAALWASWSEIQGMLLSGSLNATPQ
jgi:outer membrane protein, heavy metal efflux system